MQSDRGCYLFVTFWVNKILSSYFNKEEVLLGLKPGQHSETDLAYARTVNNFTTKQKVNKRVEYVPDYLTAFARLWPQQHHFYTNNAGQYFIGQKCR